MSTTAKKVQPPLALPDEILEVIFLRFDDAADVARAAAVCKSYCRVVRDRRFLRRYRLLHPPPVLGFLKPLVFGRFYHAEPPHRSAPAASSLVEAADFTFSFLPMEGNCWLVRDARDGRVLLSRRSTDAGATFDELVICDPLHCRYVLIPAIPEDLVTKRYSAEMNSEPFLLPAREEEDESQFRVIYNWFSKYKIFAFLFNSKTRKWRLATSFSLLPDRLIYNPNDLVRHCAGGCFYWASHEAPKHILVLDLLEMEFSITSIPFDIGRRWRAILDLGLSKVGMIVLDDYPATARNLELYSVTWQNNGGSTEELLHADRHIPLPEGYKHWNIIGASDGYLLFVGCCSTSQTVQHFIMHPKTFLIERLCKSEYPIYHALLYARFPPSLSTPSI